MKAKTYYDENELEPYRRFKHLVVTHSLDRRMLATKAVEKKAKANKEKKADRVSNEFFCFQFIINRLDSISCPVDVTDISYARIDGLLQEGVADAEGSKNARKTRNAVRDIRQHFSRVNKFTHNMQSSSDYCSNLIFILHRISMIQFRIAHAFATDSSKFLKTVGLRRVDNVCHIIVNVLAGHFSISINIS